MADKDIPRVDLASDGRERAMYDNLAGLFAIIKATEYLEKAYMEDLILDKEYESACKKLINQFGTAQKLTGLLSDADVRKFMDEYELPCEAAFTRLVLVGRPANVERVEHVGDSGEYAELVAQGVECFITTMDAVRLQMNAKDQLVPVLEDVLQSITKIPVIPSDFVGKAKLREWLAKLAPMGASEELSEENMRQLQFDLERMYEEFRRSIQRK